MVELDADDAPLPLSDLRECVSADTYSWLQEADEKEAAWEKIKQSYAFFHQRETSEATESQTNDKAHDTVCSRRVRYWTSSLVHSDGIGGIDGVEEEEEAATAEASSGAVRVAYILSDNWQGFGNQIWAASRHIANQLVDAGKCRQLLEPLFVASGRPEGILPHVDSHPLLGKSFVELGTGGGIPSWTAMWCGARVVSTDQGIAGRVRCIAECAERNWRTMKGATVSEGNETLVIAEFKPKVCPYDWGSPIDEICLALHTDGTERFDVIVATECCFMPWFHGELLDSIDMLMSDRGVALLSFALHGNVSDDEVWSIIDQAEEKGFGVEKLESQQLTVQKPEMDPKQALVHTLRLTRKSN